MAGTIVVADDDMYPHPGGGVAKRIIKLTCTHAAGALSETLGDSTTGLKHGPISGWSLRHIVTKPGATAPTDATDLTIKDADGSDLLDANGTDKVDATTVESAPAGADGEIMDRLIPGTLTIATANNAVAAAVFTLWLHLV